MGGEKGRMNFSCPNKLDPATNDAWIRDNKYCKYHKDHGHLTEHYRELNTFLETQVKNGKLKEYIINIVQGKAKEGCKPSKGKGKRERSRNPNDSYSGDQQKRRVVDVIFGGGSAGKSQSYTWKVLHTTAKPEKNTKNGSYPSEGINFQRKT